MRSSQLVGKKLCPKSVFTFQIFRFEYETTPLPFFWNWSCSWRILDFGFEGLKHSQPPKYPELELLLEDLDSVGDRAVNREVTVSLNQVSRDFPPHHNKNTISFLTLT